MSERFWRLKYWGHIYEKWRVVPLAAFFSFLSITVNIISLADVLLFFLSQKGGDEVNIHAYIHKLYLYSNWKVAVQSLCLRVRKKKWDSADRLN